MTSSQDPNAQPPQGYPQQPPNLQKQSGPPQPQASPAQGFPPPGYPAQGFQPAPPVPAAYGYGQPGPVPPGMYFDPASGLTLPQGVQLASVGRRVGAYFLSILLAIVTLVIGYIIWGLIAWGKGTSPALQVLGMKVWTPQENRPATFGTMAMRNILGTIVTGILSLITELVSLVMFLTGQQHQSLADKVASTVVVHDPGKILG
ncbi:MAG: RDD family protein [Jatrophihabitantaceae bacterium]